jgi:glycosidase
MSKQQKAEFTMSDEQKAVAYNRLFMAVFLQFILPGCPSIYYGDEVAMEGFNDPFNRGYFKWEQSYNFAYDFFAQMAKIKNTHKALQTGNISFGCHDDNGIMHITRTSDGKSITGIVNKGNTVFTVNISKDKCLVSHNATALDGKILIHKNGFALFI